MIHNQNLVAAALMGVLAASTAHAQNQPDFSRPLTLALADDTSSGGASAADEAAQQAELVKQTLNPVANLTSVPIQNNWDFGIGPAHAMKFTANIQPVIPFTLNKDWNLITRTILPVIHAEAPVNNPSAPASVRKDHSGLGDTTQSFFLSPKELVDGWVIGAGPVFLWPTATDRALGAGKWGAGPTAVLLRQTHGWTVGILANQIWSFAGWGNQNVNATFLQPFLGYSTKTYTSFFVNTESTYDWQHSQWTVPLNFEINQLLKIDKQPISLQLGYRYYAETPKGGPDQGMRFTVTFLFPK